MTYGSRSGADALKKIMSVRETCKLRNVNFHDYALGILSRITSKSRVLQKYYESRILFCSTILHTLLSLLSQVGIRTMPSTEALNFGALNFGDYFEALNFGDYFEALNFGDYFEALNFGDYSLRNSFLRSRLISRLIPYGSYHTAQGSRHVPCHGSRLGAPVLRARVKLHQPGSIHHQGSTITSKATHESRTGANRSRIHTKRSGAGR